ncbi:type II secretion system protein GspJ [Jannaschia sp. W003]|uniref:type II secretion system protein GspJ n=1 Tax=Jannaschia sp. W003 TaxID=2867012 RepID=UPI0021A3A808|nr:type II secretion system protein GspJ [Jannaschia sp. W003]UWQ23166.1 prepilin-type N-terminal cleavage/methylation domain-containing protein [Jannaschia sp. W003]
MTPARVAPPGDAGFTLVEMLVALALFAAIGLAGFTVLDTVVRVRGGTEGRLERLGEIDRALALLTLDLTEAGALVLEDGALRMARGGGGTIAWSASDGALLRGIEGGDGAPLVQRVLDEVDAVRWRLLDRGGAWHDAWPPEPAPDGEPLPALRGAEAVLELSSGGEVPRLVELVPQSPPEPAT